jgi:hypothetical protein
METEKILILSLAISALFSLLKLLEMKYIEKEMTPLKNIVRDAVIVFISSFIPIFLFIQFSNNISKFFGGMDITSSSPQIFTDTPGF